MSNYPHLPAAKSTVVYTNLGIIDLNQSLRIAIIRITIWIIPFCLCIARCQFGRQTCIDNEFFLIKCFIHYHKHILFTSSNNPIIKEINRLAPADNEIYNLFFSIPIPRINALKIIHITYIKFKLSPPT